MLWIKNNLSTVTVVLIITVITLLIIIKLIRDRKSGKKSCSSICDGCAMKNSCRKNK